jgi:hypothetical protein
MNEPDTVREPQPSYSARTLPPGTAAPALAAMKALRRAAVRARELARQTGTHLVLQRGGQVVREKPTAEMDTPAS